MTLATALHDAIMKYNVLKKPTQTLHHFLRSHPTIYKIALIVNHLFRAVMMAALMLFLPFSPFVCMGICLAGSIFYRLTVETNCAYKFALPSFAGGVSVLIAKEAVVHALAKGALASFASAFAGLIPLSAYFCYIALTVSYDIDHH